MDFQAFNLVTPRKPHRCEQCGRSIAVGEKHIKTAQVWQGDFAAYRMHIECREAWRELNFDLRTLDPYEGAPFLRDDEYEPGDKEWMRETHPLVAQRMGWA